MYELRLKEFERRYSYCLHQHLNGRGLESFMLFMDNWGVSSYETYYFEEFPSLTELNFFTRSLHVTF